MGVLPAPPGTNFVLLQRSYAVPRRRVSMPNKPAEFVILSFAHIAGPVIPSKVEIPCRGRKPGRLPFGWQAYSASHPPKKLWQ